jgi:hypothetical protein
MLTNEYESLGPLAYWSAWSLPPSGARLIYAKWISAGALTIDFDIDLALGVKSVTALAVGSGSPVSLRVTYSDATTSATLSISNSAFDPEADRVFTASGGRSITKLSIVWPSGSGAAVSISRITLDD